MSKSNGSTEVQDDNVTYVGSVQELPYVYIPFSSITAARAKYPNSGLYVYEGKVPGWRIVAFPILMHKPTPWFFLEEGADGQ